VFTWISDQAAKRRQDGVQRDVAGLAEAQKKS